MVVCSEGPGVGCSVGPAVCSRVVALFCSEEPAAVCSCRCCSCCCWSPKGCSCSSDREKGDGASSIPCHQYKTTLEASNPAARGQNKRIATSPSSRVGLSSIRSALSPSSHWRTLLLDDSPGVSPISTSAHSRHTKPSIPKTSF